MSLMFKKAEKKQAKLKIAFSGPSGSGKTYSALLLAKGMGGKIALIDTENGSASLYGDIFDFDTLGIAPPFTHDRYISAIEAAEKAGYEIIIIDSLSHAWAGEGGVLEQKSAIDMNPKNRNQFANWKKPKADHNLLKNAFLHSTSHIICTIRSKTSYSQTEENGMKKVQRQGLDPIAEPGIEYEYSVMFDMAANHSCEAIKDRTSLFDGKNFIPTEDTGRALMDWAKAGKKVLSGAEIEELKKVKALQIKSGMTDEEFKSWLSETRFRVDSPRNLNVAELRELIAIMEPCVAVSYVAKPIQSSVEFENAVNEVPDPRDGIK